MNEFTFGSPQSAYWGSLIADAFAMPVHWYYDRDALDRDYPDLSVFPPPKKIHPNSILWRSSYQALNKKGQILHDQAKFWGVREVHYHRNLQPGDNTLNFQLASLLYEQVSHAKAYDPIAWLNLYIEKMLTPGWHRDTYVEEYHRGFFMNYARGKAPLNCGIRDEHIGGLASVPALFAALCPFLSREELRKTIKTHVALTHRHSNVLRAADCLVRLLFDLQSGLPLREAMMHCAGDWFSTRKAMKWESRPDREVIGSVLSPVCYIADAFPAALYLAWKYQDDFGAAVRANAIVGGDSCHRGAVVGSLVALGDPKGLQVWNERVERIKQQQ